MGVEQSAPSSALASFAEAPTVLASAADYVLAVKRENAFGALAAALISLPNSYKIVKEDAVSLAYGLSDFLHVLNGHRYYQPADYLYANWDRQCRGEKKRKMCAHAFVRALEVLDREMAHFKRECVQHPDFWVKRYHGREFGGATQCGKILEAITRTLLPNGDLNAPLIKLATASGFNKCAALAKQEAEAPATPVDVVVPEAPVVTETIVPDPNSFVVRPVDLSHAVDFLIALKRNGAVRSLGAALPARRDAVVLARVVNEECDPVTQLADGLNELMDGIVQGVYVPRHYLGAQWAEQCQGEARDECVDAFLQALETLDLEAARLKKWCADYPNIKVVDALTEYYGFDTDALCKGNPKTCKELGQTLIGTVLADDAPLTRLTSVAPKPAKIPA